MIHNAIASIETKLTDLAWVERYGGLTVRHQNMHIDEDLNRQTVTFPVPCNTDISECGTDFLDTRLIPNTDYKSVVYFEPLSNTAIQETKDGHFTVTQSARLIVWLNLKALGVTTYCGVQSQILGDILTINGEYKQGDWIVNAKVTGIDDRETTKNIFRTYNYSNYEQHFFYPIETMSFTVQFVSEGNCASSFTLGTPIDCINYANT